MAEKPGCHAMHERNNEMTTREQIIAAAKECFDCYEDGRGRLEYSADEYGLERFYSIAFEAGRVAEREECAKVCDGLAATYLGDFAEDDSLYMAAKECSEAIRARGDTK